MKKTEVAWCQYCRKEYTAQIWGKVSIFNLSKSHNCKEEIRFQKARQKFYNNTISIKKKL